ncbi:hypothetical protein FOZ63_022519 [Perkinsus olseni]|uniref:Mei2-like C-terminal RNA recognition motif domain-containing protein n=1 Tax=Perkinsus olseni TaxID=32597 RepID=A0A7J6RQ26_PEROL|nr:hypothetical protein FOZ63_022519 [Perkinsus olseni]
MRSVLRNVPSRYTQGELMQEISFAGFVGKFDFFYLPLDRVSMANADNCFINFTTAEDASEFFDFFAGRVLGRFGSRKVVRGRSAGMKSSLLLHRDSLYT